MSDRDDERADAERAYFCDQRAAEREAAGFYDDERVAALESEVARLRGVIGEAVECIESWALYASPYFQEKWDLAGDLERFRKEVDGD